MVFLFNPATLVDGPSYLVSAIDSKLFCTIMKVFIILVSFLNAALQLAAEVMLTLLVKQHTTNILITNYFSPMHTIKICKQTPNRRIYDYVNSYIIDILYSYVINILSNSLR